MIYTVRNILYIQYATDCIYSTYHDIYSTYQMIYTVSRKPGRSGSTEPDVLVLAETVSTVVFLYSAPNQMSGLVH